MKLLNGNGHYNGLDELTLKERKTRTRWSEREENQLIEAMVSQTLKTPNAGFAKVIEKAQASLVAEKTWQEDRIRHIQGPGNVEELHKRYREACRNLNVDRKTLEAAKAVLREQQRSGKSQTDWLDSLSDEEVKLYFGDRILSNTAPAELLSHFSPADLLATLPISQVAAAAVQRLLQPFDHLNTPAPVPQKGNLFKLVLAGVTAPKQPEVVRALDGIFDVEFVSLVNITSKSISENADLVLLWKTAMRECDREKLRTYAKQKNIPTNAILETPGTLAEIVAVAKSWATR